MPTALSSVLTLNRSCKNSSDSIKTPFPKPRFSKLTPQPPKWSNIFPTLFWPPKQFLPTKCSNFVKKLPKGLQSEVGERGVRLSGGQKQRIQIARAILRNAPILVLDEATSNLDAKSEKEVQEALGKLMENKLVIVIAHRFSTIQNVDKVAVLEKGTIVEFGDPRELAHKPGIYSELLQYQIEGNKKLLEGFEIY